MTTVQPGGLTALRDLAGALIWRELALRYKRSVLGLAWALVEPLVLVATYVAFFGYVLKAGAGVDNYPLYVLFGTLAWVFFSTTIEQSTGVLLEHAPLARKIPFPWEILFIAIGVSRLSTLAFGLCLALVALAVFGDAPSWQLLWFLPLGVVCVSALALGISLIVGVLQPLLRDVSFLTRYGLRLAFYAVPIAYPATLVPEALRATFAFNPLVGVLWFFQASVAPAASAPPILALIGSVIFCAVMPVLGWLCFRRLQPRVADVL